MMATSSPKSRGFGFDPEDPGTHFSVTRRGEAIEIAERHVGDEGQPDRRVVKVILNSYHWARIEDVVSSEFNARLQHQGLPLGRWGTPETHLAPHLGRELVLLGWVIEGADPTVIPNMVANWRGLAPEERWWFYTTINATSGHPEHGRDRGWRKALKIAFAENPAEAAATVDANAPGRRRPRRQSPADGQLLLIPED
jgi:hypothetical protein